MFGKDEGTETRLRKQFWKELGDDRVVMLGLKGVEDDQTRPMTAQVDQPDDDGAGAIYFFASNGEGVGREVGGGGTQRVVATFASKGHNLFAHIHGTLAPSQDRAVIERLWNPIVASWYKGGKDDPDLLLLRLDAERADIWEASGAATLKAAAMKMLFDTDPGKELQKDHQAEVKL